MIDITVNKNSEFLSKLLHAKNIIYLNHLNPTNPSKFGAGQEHKALNDLYEEIGSLIDKLIESYQGKYGLINLRIKESEKTNILKYLEEVSKQTEQFKFNESWLNNILDEVSCAIYKTIYKLKYLT